MPAVPGKSYVTSGGIPSDLRNRVIGPGEVPGVDPRIGLDLVTDPSKELRPIYRYIQMYEDVMYPWDPAVIKACRGVDPQFCPLSTVSIYQAPDGSLHRFMRHLLALEVNPLSYREAPFRNLVPATYGVNKGRHPNVLLKSWHGPQPSDRVTPGAYWPIDWSLVRWLKEKKATYEPNAAKVTRSMVESEALANQRKLEAMDKEIDYRLEHDRHHIQELAQRVTPEMKERGVLYDTTPDPFVHLGR